MKLRLKTYRAGKGDKIDLKKWPTEAKGLYADKEEYKALLQSQVRELSDLQQRLYAGRKHALLVILQAMDAAGKDGVIRHVMSGVNPQGCHVASFGRPSTEELRHDFLWRCVRQLPERGMIGIFNRSYYEEVLVVRVHPEILGGQNLPEKIMKADDFWQNRMRSIRDLEKHLVANGTTIVKICLNISRAEQKKRLLERIEDPAKRWKAQSADAIERSFWKPYRKAYEEAIEETSTDEAPWYIVPADDGPAARLIVSEIIIETLKGLDLQYPEVDEKQLAELMEMKAKLEAE